MKKLLTVICILFAVKSYSQKGVVVWNPKFSKDTIAYIAYNKEWRVSIKNDSDTVVIHSNKIRFVKIGDEVFEIVRSASFEKVLPNKGFIIGNQGILKFAEPSKNYY